jgi:hypothetical protein
VKLPLTWGLTTAITNDHKEVTLKKVTLLAAIVLALAMSASASDLIDFTKLAPTTTPQFIGGAYHNLFWPSIGYVSVPLYDQWLAAGGNDPDDGPFDQADGMNKGPEAQVAIIGGPMCYDKSLDDGYGQNEYPSFTVPDVCRGSIQAGGTATFRPDYVIASEGWKQDGHQFVTVEAYLAGKKIGTQRFDLHENAQKYQLVLPNEWGAVSELVFWPSPGASVVLYVVHLK